MSQLKGEWKAMSPHYEERVVGKNEWLTAATITRDSTTLFTWEVAVGAYTVLGHVRASGTVATKNEAKRTAEYMYRKIKEAMS